MDLWVGRRSNSISYSIGREWLIMKIWHVSLALCARERGMEILKLTILPLGTVCSKSRARRLIVD